MNVVMFDMSSHRSHKKPVICLFLCCIFFTNCKVQPLENKAGDSNPLPRISSSQPGDAGSPNSLSTHGVAEVYQIYPWGIRNLIHSKASKVPYFLVFETYLLIIHFLVW